MKVSGSTIVDYWIQWLNADAEAIALVSPDGVEHTRNEVDSYSETLVSRFSEVGLGRGNLILFCLPNGLEWLGGLLASAKLGAVSVFADPGTRAEDLEGMAETFGAKCVCTSDGIVSCDRVRSRRFRRTDILMGKLTSGSTGDPKCLFFTHAEMLADGELTEKAFEYGAKERILGLVPWGHSYGLGTVIIPALRSGLVICGLDSPLPARIGEVCSRLRPTVFPVVPTVIRALGRSRVAQGSFESVRILITAGSRLDPAIAREFFEVYGLKPKNLYGSSETGSVACDPIGDITLEGRTVGKVIEGVSVTRSRSGRFKVVSPAVYSYQNRQACSGDVAANCMGDYGYVDEEGYLFIQSRAKGFVKVGEKRIGLADVEARLSKLEGVSDACALGMDTPNGQILAAAIESNLPRKALAKQMRERVPSKCRPRHWVVLESFPVTPRGKVSKSEILKLLEAISEG